MQFGIIIALIVMAAIIVVAGILTGIALKDKIVERLKKWGVISEAVISKKKLTRWIAEAETNGQAVHLSVEELDALDEMEDDELVMADLKKNGKIGKVTRIKGEEGISQSLKNLLDEKDGMIIMEG